MFTNYQIALDLVRQSQNASTMEEAALLVAQAQVYATLAVAER